MIIDFQKMPFIIEKCSYLRLQNLNLLKKYLSDNGKSYPQITSVSFSKQKLAREIKSKILG